MQDTPSNNSDRSRDERGATMLEYGFLVALIAIVVAAGAALLGTAVLALFTSALALLP